MCDVSKRNWDRVTQATRNDGSVVNFGWDALDRMTSPVRRVV